MATVAKVLEAFVQRGRKSVNTQSLQYDHSLGRLLSYGEHYPLAQWHDAPTGIDVVLVNSANSSRTTNKHRTALCRMLRSSNLDWFKVKSPTLANVVGAHWRQFSLSVVTDTPAEHHKLNLNYLIAAARDSAAETRYRQPSEYEAWLLTDTLPKLQRVRDYCATFAVAAPTPLPQHNPKALVAWVTNDSMRHNYYGKRLLEYFFPETQPQQETATA